MTAVRAIYFYKPRAQGLATEVRTGHVGVADPPLRDGGQAQGMGHTDVWGRMAWPWVAKVS